MACSAPEIVVGAELVMGDKRAPQIVFRDE